MDFGLTDQQRLLVNVAREFLDKSCPPTVAQELALDPRGFRDELWSRISALGWPGLLVPAEHGGSEASLLDVILLVEELGRACVPGPYVASAVVATAALLAGASRAQRARVLPAMALGDRIATIAVAEDAGAFAPERIGTVGDVGGRVTGRKLFVKDAHVAHDLLVATRGNGGVNVFLVETRRPGVSLFPLDTMSGEKLFEVALDQVETRREDLVGEPGRGWDVVAPALRVGALARSAEMLGAAQRILDLTVDYAKVRVQSGRPIGAFQAIQHHCADMLRNVEATRSLLHYAAWRNDGGVDEAATAMVKAYAADACLGVARRAHQVFGAIGYCEEHPLHLLHKRIHAAAIDFGDRAAHLDTVAQAIHLVTEAAPATL